MSTIEEDKAVEHVELAKDPVAHLVAVEQIRALAYRYAMAVDGRDLDALVALFVEDVGPGMDSRERDGSYAADPTIGREALRRWFAGSLVQFGMSILSVTNHVVTMEAEDRATGIVYCHAEMEVGDEWIVQAIRYRDEYERHGGTWLFRRREHGLWYSLDARRVPIAGPPVTYPPSARGRGSLPEAWPTWEAFWQAHGAAVAADTEGRP